MQKIMTGKQLIEYLTAKDKGNRKFDLHCHSEVSDGNKDLIGLLLEAKANGLDLLVITDHDTAKVFEPIFNGSIDPSIFGVQVTTGVEVTTLTEHGMVETLMYGFDYKQYNDYQYAENSDFRYLTREFKLKRNFDIFRQRLACAYKAGLITEEQADIRNYIKLTEPNKTEEIPFVEFGKDITTLIKSTNLTSPFEEIRSTIAQLKGKDEPICHNGGVELAESVIIDGRIYSVSYDYFNSQLFAAIKQNPDGQRYLDEFAKPGGEVGIRTFGEFSRFITQNPANPIYVKPDGFWPTQKELVEFAHKLGGIAVLAHPYNYPQLEATPDEIMQTAVDNGVDGIECMYGFATYKEMVHIKHFAEAQDRPLVLTGGTDKHKDFTNVENTIPWTLGQTVRTKLEITTENLANIEELAALQDSLAEAQ